MRARSGAEFPFLLLAFTSGPIKQTIIGWEEKYLILSKSAVGSLSPCRGRTEAQCNKSAESHRVRAGMDRLCKFGPGKVQASDWQQFQPNMPFPPPGLPPPGSPARLRPQVTGNLVSTSRKRCSNAQRQPSTPTSHVSFNQQTNADRHT